MPPNALATQADLKRRRIRKKVAALILAMFLKPRKQYETRILLDGLLLGRCGSIMMSLLNVQSGKLSSLIRISMDLSPVGADYLHAGHI